MVIYVYAELVASAPRWPSSRNGRCGQVIIQLDLRTMLIFLNDQVWQIQLLNHPTWTWIQTNFLCLPAYSSHLLPLCHTRWLHPAQALTAAPTTAAAAALQAGTSSAKPTSTSEACRLQPQTMTWSSSVSREYHTSSHHYLLLINHWFFGLLSLESSYFLWYESFFDIYLLK